MRPYFDASDFPSFRAMVSGDDARPYRAAVHVNCALVLYTRTAAVMVVAGEAKDVRGEKGGKSRLGSWFGR